MSITEATKMDSLLVSSLVYQNVITKNRDEEIDVVMSREKECSSFRKAVRFLFPMRLQ